MNDQGLALSLIYKDIVFLAISISPHLWHPFNRVVPNQTAGIYFTHCSYGTAGTILPILTIFILYFHEVIRTFLSVLETENTMLLLFLLTYITYFGFALRLYWSSPQIPAVIYSLGTVYFSSISVYVIAARVTLLCTYMSIVHILSIRILLLFLSLTRLLLATTTRRFSWIRIGLIQRSPYILKLFNHVARMELSDFTLPFGYLTC